MRLHLKRVIIALPFSTESEINSFVAPFKTQGFTHVPVVRETLADLDTPVSTYLKLAAQPYTYLFESVQGGDKWGRYSIIGLPCKRIYRFFGKKMTVEQDGEIVETSQVEQPLEKVRELQAQYKVAHQ